MGGFDLLSYASSIVVPYLLIEGKSCSVSLFIVLPYLTDDDLTTPSFVKLDNIFASDALVLT